jgi:hypothetical protein
MRRGIVACRTANNKKRASPFFLLKLPISFLCRVPTPESLEGL